MASAEHPDGGFEPRIGRSVSLDHAAEILGVSRRTIYNRIRDGRLQTIRTLGGSQRVLIDSVTDTRETVEERGGATRHDAAQTTASFPKVWSPE